MASGDILRLGVGDDYISFPSKVAGYMPVAPGANAEFGWTTDGTRFIYYADKNEGVNSFRRYDVTNPNAGWVTLAPLPAVGAYGLALKYADGFIYYVGASNQGFYRYEIAANTWSAALANLLVAQNNGCNLLWDGSDTIYAWLTGTSFTKYSISGNVWTALQGPTPSVSGGANMVYDGDDTIYYQSGGSASNPVYAYSISRNVHSAMPGSTSGVGSVYFPGGRYIYRLSTPGASDVLVIDRYTGTVNTAYNVTIGMANNYVTRVLCMQDGSVYTKLAAGTGFFKNNKAFKPTPKSLILS
ncbi:hypothetical protein SD71_16260 [Cohnella kolymensis]|uniref:Tachylectin 2 domain-containing protein n=1 Tax=Cohnella kolymensis TaxID=1590652 RepID=A0ABR5A296_9BACL|nr:hypothetical protein [Cohnella kolymensis]KIL35176.1 hypothetical protein SD71_16260 [Cohnella kolymensis]